MAAATTRISIVGDAEPDALLTSDPLALLIGMVLDQQVPFERAFRAPYELRRRLGTELDPARIAAMDPDTFAAHFSAKPALHRFPSAMARRVQEVCRIVAEEHGGDAAAIWTGAPDGDALVARLASLPGFGPQKARIFAALLAKRFGVRPGGWEAATAPYGERGTFMSVADIDSPEALAKVREYKAGMKAAARAAGG